MVINTLHKGENDDDGDDGGDNDDNNNNNNTAEYRKSENYLPLPKTYDVTTFLQERSGITSV